MRSFVKLVTEIGIGGKTAVDSEAYGAAGWPTGAAGYFAGRQ